MKGAKPRAGDRVSEYVLDERIGAGGYGEVWKAFHAHLPGVVAAIKIPTDSRWLDQLRREGALLHRLRGEHVVEVRGLDPDADPPYLVMEYVDGKSLRQVLDARRPVPPADAIAIYRQALLALRSAQDAGIVHRDVKPENILIDAAGTVKLSDFGLGRCLETGGSALLQSVAGGASAAAVAGTLRYMSPEQRTGGPVDARTDLYSLGIVLFEMLAGDTPQGAELPSDLDASLPPWADRIVSRCYTRLEKRYASAAEALADLDRLVPPRPPETPGGPPPRGRGAPGARPAPGDPSPGSAFGRPPDAPPAFSGPGPLALREPAPGPARPPWVAPFSALHAALERAGSALREGGGAAAVAILFLAVLAAAGLAVLAMRAAATSRARAEARAVVSASARLSDAREALKGAFLRKDWKRVWEGLSRDAQARIAFESGYPAGDPRAAAEGFGILVREMDSLPADDPPGALRAFVRGLAALSPAFEDAGPGRARAVCGGEATEWAMVDGVWKLDGPSDPGAPARSGNAGQVPPALPR